MLVMTIGRYRHRTSYLASTALTNVNQFGSHGIAHKPYSQALAMTAHVNTNQFGSLAVGCAEFVRQHRNDCAAQHQSVWCSGHSIRAAAGDCAHRIPERQPVRC